MYGFFDRLKFRIQRFMQGRNGNDSLNVLLLILAMILLILSCFEIMRYLSIAALVLLVLAVLRCLSKNLFARQKENGVYTRFIEWFPKKFKLLRNMWKDRKTHRYMKCPHCKSMIRIRKPPKGKTITITCPGCRHSFDKKT